MTRPARRLAGFAGVTAQPGETAERLSGCRAAPSRSGSENAKAWSWPRHAIASCCGRSPSFAFPR
ncbi:hypothetical protein [Streptomyces gelaticus]|uniref:hypothetical protein n=1 Tax=Streptomyces gelaticus TaxID=285446 RepID=UPI00357151ED